MSSYVILPGPGRRMRAAGQVGEFAGDRGQLPQFGAALAQAGGESAGGALRVNEQTRIRRSPLNARPLLVIFSPWRAFERTAAACSCLQHKAPPAGARTRGGGRTM